MTLLRHLVAMFRHGTPGFAPLERAILAGVAGRLDTERRGRLARRIASINLVQRLDGGREVNGYHLMRGKPVMDPAMRLTDHDGELKLADIAFRDENGLRNEAAIWLVNGSFFSINFSQPTEHMLDMEPQELDVTLHIP